MKNNVDMNIELAKLVAEQKRHPNPTLSEKIANARVKRSAPLNNPFEVLDQACIPENVSTLGE